MTAIDFSPIIFASTLVVGGFAFSFTRFPELRKGNIIACLYLISIVSTITFNFLSIMLFIFGPLDPRVPLVITTIQAFPDGITALALETCYILRLFACVRLVKFRKAVYLLFIFPVGYTVADMLTITENFSVTPPQLTQAWWGMFNFMFMVGCIISHISTIVILIRNMGNLKDPLEKRNLIIIGAAQVINQAFFLAFCCLSFVDVVYSTALIYFSWAIDHIIFSLVNDHIRSFITSSGSLEQPNSSSVNESQEMSKVSVARVHSEVIPISVVE